MSVRESSVIAALMNTRGLVELIVLNLGDAMRCEVILFSRFPYALLISSFEVD